VASGKDLIRQGIQTMFNELSENDTVFVAELSRFSRDPQTGLDALNRLRQKKVKLISLNPKLEVPGDPIQEELFTAHIRIYKLERQRTSEQVKVNMERLSAEGKLRSRAPFGYLNAGKDKDFEPIHQQIAVRDKIIELYKGGMKITHISNKLNTDGDNLTLCLNKPDQEKICKFFPATIKRILIDNGLVEGTGSYADRTPLEQRIASHHKTEQ